MGIVLHCLHLSTARSVEDCEKCLNLLLPLALLLLPMARLLSLRMQRFLRSKDSTLVMEDMGPLLPRKTELFSGKMPLLPRHLHLPLSLLYRLLPLSNRLLLLLNLLTMTMLIHQLILTSTHSSTLMTPLIETSSLTGTGPTLEVTLLLPMVSPPALTALESTPSSTLLMHLTGVEQRKISLLLNVCPV